jgi:hypothetical protein
VANESKLHKKIALVYNPCFIQVIIHIGIKFYLITIKFILSMNTHKCLLKSAHYNPFHCRSLVFSDIFTRPKRGAIFAPPLRHIIKKLTAVGSHIDGSDHPQILFMRDPVCLGGTHVRDPRGFK